MRWSKIGIIFVFGFFIGTVMAGIFWTSRFLETPYYGQYQAVKFQECFEPYRGIISKNGDINKTQFDIARSEYFLEQRLDNFTLIVQQIEPEMITTDRAGVNYTYNHGLGSAQVMYATRSGVIKAVKHENSKHYVSIESEADSTMSQYSLSSIGPAIRVGAKVKGGQYLGRAEMSESELRKAVKNINPLFDFIIERKPVSKDGSTQ